MQSMQQWEIYMNNKLMDCLCIIYFYYYVVMMWILVILGDRIATNIGGSMYGLMMIILCVIWCKTDFMINRGIRLYNKYHSTF